MTDLISKKAAIKAIDDLPNCYNGYSDTYDKAYIIGVIEEVPTIEPKRGCEYWDGESGFCALQRPADPVKHGKWERDSEGEPYCSLCGKYTNDLQDEPFEWNGAIGWALKLPNYCSRCGARMI